MGMKTKLNTLILAALCATLGGALVAVIAFEQIPSALVVQLDTALGNGAQDQAAAAAAYPWVWGGAAVGVLGLIGLVVFGCIRLLGATESVPAPERAPW